MALPHCCPSASFFLPSPPPSLSSPPPTNCLRRRTRHQMSTELRLSHRLITASWSTPAWASNPSSRFASYGFPSSSLAPFILGRFPKYSKPSLKSSRIIKASSQQNHPAFKPFSRTKPPPVPPEGEDCISLTEKGITYKLQNAPFEFQYSYTETPKVKPLALREPAFLPFGPKETPRPWTGRAPLPGTKKKLPEFDSFKLPPPGKKGVKSIQAPGPFKSGSAGPKYTISRDEILGEPLTKVEVAELVRGCLKTSRQLNIGRNGLTHNMLDNIHAHWKRRRVCKIKCKGVCTVDMDNVCDVLEEKTGGKIIHRRGGLVFLFRGRNYNYKFRPRYPLMLWRPITPVYPRLIKPVPEGLTPEQANEMRLKGSNLPPICKLGKNGVYNNLPKQVREAFEACELARVNCEGMNKSDYKKIGGKLKDLVPCVLISFEGEHILMWRGLNWKSSLPPVEEIGGLENASSSKIHGSEKSSSSSMHESVLVDAAPKSAAFDISENNSRSTNKPYENKECSYEPKPENTSINDGTMTNMPSEAMNEQSGESKQENNTNQFFTVSTEATKLSEESKIEGIESKIDEETETACLEGVKLLLNQAMESGSALMLSEIECNDSDIVYQRSFELAKTARKGPSFQVVGNKSKSSVQKKKDKIKKKGVPVLESANPQPEREIMGFNSEKSVDRSSSSNRRMKKEEFLALLPSVLSQHSLKVDELARLLS